MGKIPGFTFYTGDWLKDPELRRCSKAAKGVWIDMLALMFECADRGVFSTGGRSWTDQEIAAAIGGDIAENLSCIAELLLKGVAHRNESGAIFCKRMVRDQEGRLQTKERVQKHRSNAKCNAVVTPLYEEEREEEKEVVFDVGSKPPNSDELVEAIARVHPSNWRAKGKMLIPHAHCEVIVQAIIRDGQDAVMQGTKAYAEAVGRWPIQERQMAIGVVRFYNESHYLKDPMIWEKTHGEASKAVQRTQRNREVLVAAARSFTPNVGPGEPDSGERTNAGGVTVLAGELPERAPGNARVGIPRIPESGEILPKARGHHGTD